ncbi:ATPase, T2SS/T4P/T4SS family [Lacticaseibacillus hegangensis]|uniref:ATPase, T2SS/T4P/T4SS family n=1 Tax=Lacticaseibacillus hegangensis TaxID=2486010 RepID=A0ABW4CY70_9LACO|nr:ATPase, T2SS/T4P/T4SS family [Lacticaseibacillus hegangensis]
MEAGLLEIFEKARAALASDVYFLPKPTGVTVLIRTATGWGEATVRTLGEGASWIRALKYDAGMNVAETRRPQLGALPLAQLGITLRLSTVGDYTNQEALVARLIYGVPGLDEWTAPIVEDLVDRLNRQRMLALCGPTGSGKTTLLYQVATALGQARMVMTIEDPVEIAAPAFLQLQVNPEAGMSYASLLKAALRKRPDVLVIGEIRDFETAQAACEAAISGHVVLTTVHAKQAAQVPLRLTALGVARPLVQAALRMSADVHLESDPVVHPVVSVLVHEEGAND